MGNILDRLRKSQWGGGENSTDTEEQQATVKKPDVSSLVSRAKQVIEQKKARTGKFRSSSSVTSGVEEGDVCGC